MGIEGADSSGDGRKTYPHFSVPIGLTFGFTTAGALCLAYAWINRIPEAPFETDHSAITAMLWHTTIAVGVAVGFVLATFVPRSGRTRSTSRGALWRMWVAPGLLIVALGGLLYLYRGTPKKIFDDASWQQAGLDLVQVTTVARVAWWCACLAVFSLAFVWLAGHVLAEDRPRPEMTLASNPRLVLPVAIVTVLAVLVGLAVHTVRAAPDSTTAARIDSALPDRISGEVAYRIDLPHTRNVTVFPGGAGFLRIHSGSFDTQIEGYDGATGQRRWVFKLPGNGYLQALAVTGFGPDSVAVLQASYRTAGALIGLDATTGELLWVSHGDTERKFQVGPIDTPQLSEQVVLMGQAVAEGISSWRNPAEVDWTALSPRTGETLWSTTVRQGCRAQPRVARDVVVMVRCDAGPYDDEVAYLLDPQTGQRRGSITASQLGIDRRASGLDGEVWVYTDPDSTFATLYFHSADPHRDGVGRAVDLASGRPFYSIPKSMSAALIPPDWLRSADPRASPEILVDLPSGRTLPTDRIGTRRLLGIGGQWARVGPELATLLPSTAAPDDSHAPLTLIDDTGAVRTLTNPCEDPDLPDTAPSVTTIPGALLVDCGWQLVGLR
ncbi:outer membrane protein assembly factor BamB family protein [Mycobacterium sp. NPDC004974]